MGNITITRMPGAVWIGASTAPDITNNGDDAGGGAGNWSSNTKNMQVLASQADSNEKAGRLLAADNNKYVELRITSPANYLGAFDIVPSIGMYNWGLADALFKRGLDLNGKNLICRSVSANMIADGTLQTSVVFEVEAIGEDGIPGNYPSSYPAPTISTPENPSSPDIYGGTGAFIITYGGSIISAFIRGDKTVNAGIELDSGTFYDAPIVALSGARALVVTSAATKFYGMVLSLSGDLISSNDLTLLFSVTIAGSSSLSKISGTKAIMCFTESGAHLYKAQAAIITISGLKPSPGSTLYLNADVLGTDYSESNIDVATLSLSAAITVWTEKKANPTTHAIYARILNVSGDPPTAGNYKEITSFASGNIIGQINVISLTATLAVVFYCSPDDGKVYGNALTISGTSITVGAAKEIIGTAGDPAGYKYAARVDDTTFVLANTQWVQVVAGSVSGGVITPGSIVKLKPAADGENPVVSYYDGNVTVVYQDTTAGELKRQTLTLSGTTLTDLNDATTNGEIFPGASFEGGITAVV